MGRRFVEDVDEGFEDLKVSGIIFFVFEGGRRCRWRCGGLDLEVGIWC